MDVTTIQCGKSTRKRLKEYKAANDLRNYDDAINHLLDEVQA